MTSLILQNGYISSPKALRQFSAALELVCVLTAQRNGAGIDKSASLTTPAASMTFNMVVV
jgi:hypothetical protein